MKPFRVTQGKGGRQKCTIHADHVSAVIQLEEIDHYKRTSEAQCMIILIGGSHHGMSIYANQPYEEVMELWLAALGESR